MHIVMQARPGAEVSQTGGTLSSFCTLQLVSGQKQDFFPSER